MLTIERIQLTVNHLSKALGKADDMQLGARIALCWDGMEHHYGLS